METNKTILMRDVVAIKDRKTVGSVKDLRIECESGAVSHYIIGDASLSTLAALPSTKVIAVGDTFVTIEGESVLMPAESRSTKSLLEEGCRLVGLEVFSRAGDRIGSVAGFTFDTKTGKIEQIDLGDEGIFTAESILFFSPSYIFVDDREVQVSPEKKNPVDTVAEKKAAPLPETAAVESQEQGEAPVREEAEKAVAAVQEADEPEDADDEDRALKEILLGAVLGDDVVSEDGQFKLTKGSTITVEDLRAAHKHDALLLLTMNVDI